jgi:hypothetical protein
VKWLENIFCAKHNQKRPGIRKGGSITQNRLSQTFFFFGGGTAFVRQAFYHWVTPPALFALVILEMGAGLAFCLGQSGPSIFMLSVPGTTGMCHHAKIFPLRWGSCKHFCLGWTGTLIFLTLVSHVAREDRCIPLCWIEVSQTFCPGWSWTKILPISASHVARITGVSYQHSAKSNIF